MAGISLDRVVIDTNNILSLFFAEEYDFFVYLKIQHGISLFTCSQQLDEMVAVMQYSKVKKFLRTKPNKLLKFFNEHSINIQVDERFDRVSDIKDNYLIDLAYTAKSFYIVTGDREVLTLKHVGRIQIISFTEFKRLIATKK